MHGRPCSQRDLPAMRVEEATLAQLFYAFGKVSCDTVGQLYSRADTREGTSRYIIGTIYSILLTRVAF